MQGLWNTATLYVAILKPVIKTGYANSRFIIKITEIFLKKYKYVCLIQGQMSQLFPEVGPKTPILISTYVLQ